MKTSELLIIEAYCQGKDAKWVAEKLGLSQRTIEAQRDALRVKCGVKTIPELIAYCYENGLITDYKPNEKAKNMVVVKGDSIQPK